MSYRTRLLAISSTIVAAVIAVVLYFGWSSMLRYQVSQLDAQLCAEAKRIVALDNREAVSGKVITDLQQKLGIASQQQMLMQLVGREGKQKSRSAHWPDTFDAQDLSWSQPKPVPPKEVGPTVNTAPPQRGKPQAQKKPNAEIPSIIETCQQAQFELEGERWRASMYSRNNGHSMIAVDLSATENQLKQAMLSALWAIVPISVLLCAFSAWLIASITVRPLNRLNRAMQAVNHNELSQRLPSKGEDTEFRTLIESYNRMLGRLESSFEQASRFSSDAAHELKTPLTVLRAKIELAMREPKDADLHDLLDEVSRLSSIVRRLLLLSQADSGTLSLNLVPSNLSDILELALDDLSLLVDEQRIKPSIEPNLSIECDQVLITQLLNNLLGNAARYALADSAIVVKAVKTDNLVEIKITNRSLPIDEGQREKLFERFYRASNARDERLEGSGLGLSLSREIARAHGGDLILLDSRDDRVSMQLTLPTHRN